MFIRLNSMKTCSIRLGKGKWLLIAINRTCFMQYSCDFPWIAGVKSTLESQLALSWHSGTGGSDLDSACARCLKFQFTLSQKLLVQLIITTLLPTTKYLLRVMLYFRLDLVLSHVQQGAILQLKLFFFLFFFHSTWKTS